MISRHQLPVSSPVALSALAAGFRSAFRGQDERLAEPLGRELEMRFGVHAAVPCDSGTSALVLALRATVPTNGTALFPSYACVDLAAAARFAGIRVRLYDLDPSSLDADLDSLRSALRRGADVLLAVHLYGFPVDVPAMKKVAHEHGVALIEDAAQAAGSELRGRRVGSFGDLSILSFGRGKGTTGGRGGAVLVSDEHWRDRLDGHLRRVRTPRAAGWGDLTRAAAQWLVGRPSLYGLPSALPGLHLGEMVYHPAHEPAAISRAAATLVRAALRQEAEIVRIRRRNAALIANAIHPGAGVTAIRPIAGAEPGYLRFPVLDGGSRTPQPALGVMRGYPRALFEQEELRACLHDDEPEPLGGRHLREHLFTLPVHEQLTTRDIERLRIWLARAPSR